MAQNPTPHPSLAISDYDVIGFDLDHTLAKYNIPHLFDKVSDGFDDFLVNAKLIDEKNVKPFAVDKNFCTRGLVFDIAHGNFLKLAEDGTILRASHGTTFLSPVEIKEEYGNDRHWPEFESLISVVNNVGDRYRIFENYFDMPIAVTAARCVDLFDVENGGRDKKASYGPIFQNVLRSVNDLYSSEQFTKHAGGFFPDWKENTNKYVQPCSKNLKEWLKKLRREKKFLFVMTSSYIDYATASLDFILGCDWREYFDLVLTYSRKPGFFNKERPFLGIDKCRETEPVSEMKKGCCYSQGNYKLLMEFLGKETGKQNPKVLFVGDSIRSDVFPAKQYAGWDTMLILEEIVSEQHTVVTSHDEGEPPEKQPKLQFGERPQTYAFRHQILTSTVDSCTVKEPEDKEKEYLTSSCWGSLFNDDHPIKDYNDGDTVRAKNKHRMNTLWGYIIRKYADVAIPMLDYITDIPLDHRMEVFDHTQPFHWGFYPFLPCALKKLPPPEK